MKPQKALEIAESFVNGNISWVKERTKSKVSYLSVLREMKDCFPNEVESFERICCK